MNGSAQRNESASATGAALFRKPVPARQTMTAIIQDDYGSQDVLQLRDIDKQVAGDDDVLVRVHAAGPHIGDWHVMTGLASSTLDSARANGRKCCR